MGLLVGDRGEGGICPNQEMALKVRSRGADTCPPGIAHPHIV